VADRPAPVGRRDAEPSISTLRHRSLVIGPVAPRLRTLDAQGTLERPLEDIRSSLAHMAVNRLLKSGGNVNEARVLHAPARIDEAEIARRGSGLACEPVSG
jgi:hypothetical protein